MHIFEVILYNVFSLLIALMLLLWGLCVLWVFFFSFSFSFFTSPNDLALGKQLFSISNKTLPEKNVGNKNSFLSS